MKVRVLTQRSGGAVQAWAPGLSMFPVVGATEDEAISKLKEKVVHPEWMAVPGERILEIAEPVAEGPGEAETLPTASGIRMTLAAGAGMLLLGLTGVLFYWAVVQEAFTPILLFAPLVLAAFGIVGMAMSFFATDSKHITD